MDEIQPSEEASDAIKGYCVGIDMTARNCISLLHLLALLPLSDETFLLMDGWMGDFRATSSTQKRSSMVTS